MIILQFDNKQYRISDMNDLCEWLRIQTGERVIALPKDIDVLLDASSQKLYQIRNDIDEIIEKKKAMSADTKGFFYTVEPIFQSVTKEEFDEFIDNYPRKLQRDCYAVCEPPLITYNDFELADRWPHSIIAEFHAYSDDPNDYYYCAPEERRFSVMKNYEEVFNSKTGNMIGD